MTERADGVADGDVLQTAYADDVARARALARHAV